MTACTSTNSGVSVTDSVNCKYISTATSFAQRGQPCDPMTSYMAIGTGSISNTYSC
jgi:hypothetical protein